MTGNRWSRSGATLLLLAMGASAALLGGCAGREKAVVAEVGKAQITVGEVEATWARLDSASRPDIGTEEGRKSLVQDLIKKQLLESEAHAVLGEPDAGMQRRLRRFTESALLEALQRQEVSAKVRITEQDLKNMYERRKQILTARHILVPTREEADEILRLISEGATFEALAQQRSKDHQSGQNGGSGPGSAASGMARIGDQPATRQRCSPT